MCGILGIASQTPLTNRTWLAKSRDTLNHRGPDDAGLWWSEDGCVGLAHRRLSIIDLSPAGHQPMLDKSEQFCIVFNGEIYNFRDLRCELEGKGYQFHSATDTEVILAAYREWGTDCVKRFNGMFAFALCDRKSRTIFMARDRAGEKPLFYRYTNNQLVFASELKALMADPSFLKQINPEALDCYLAFGYVPGEYCILKGVNKLPPAHALTFNLDSGKLNVWRYWQMPELQTQARDSFIADETALLNELENLLEDSVQRQLVADVPVGILLSGGVDSSLITAMAVRSSSQIKTFTIRFPGYGKYDETEHARLIASHFNTEHTELEATASTVDILPLLAEQFDEPIVDSSMIPTFLVSQLIRQHCTVALGGDGGDELFGGYSHYNRLLSVEEKFGSIPFFLRTTVARGAERFLPLGFKGRNWVQGLGTDFKEGLPLVASYFDYKSRLSLLAQDKKNYLSSSAEQIRKRRIVDNPSLLERATRLDFENYLAEDILVKVDRASMLNSLEVRAPFLDYRLIEFAFAKVPSYLKTTPSSRKILLKQLAARTLPPEFDRQRKQGFSIPLASWLTMGPWQDFFKEVLLGQETTLFNRKFIANLFAGQMKGYANSERLFALVLLELWCKKYNIRTGLA